jgi:hypothetical protein
LFSHWDVKSGTWASNYEQQNFWPAVQQKVWSTSQFIDTIRLIFGDNQSSYSINISDVGEASTGYYLIFYGTSSAIAEHHGLAFLTPDIVDRCNQGQLKLLIVFTHETFDNRIGTYKWFQSFCNKLSLVGITKTHSVVILTGTKFITRMTFDHRCEFIFYPWFEADLQMSVKSEQILPTPINFDLKNKHYINLNLAVRTHRFLMVMYLIYRGVKSQGHISWKNSDLRTWQELLGSYGYDHQDFSWKKQVENFDNGNMDFVRFLDVVHVLQSMNLDDVYMGQNSPRQSVTWTGGKEYYLSSWVDLVSETHCELYGDVFLTEKSFKPMAYGLSFVLNASQHSLSLIKQLGYQTFPELFDESYDSIPGGMYKISIIGDQIVSFCQDPAKLNLLKNHPDLLAKLQHNQDLFWNKNHGQQLGELLHQAWIRGRA